MLQKLMGSKTRVKILTLFIINPKREYYAREIERELKSNFEAIRTELINLEKIGLLRSRISGKQRYYSINTGHVLFPEFKSMILKTVGLGSVLKNAFKEANKIEIAFIYGSYAKNAEDVESDIDLFVIGSVSIRDLQTVISDIESKFQREINPTIYPREELQSKFRSKNHFILSVLKEPKIFLKGDEHGLRELVKDR